MVARTDTQYTIRGVPKETDRRMREIAQERNLSLNAAVLELLTKELEQPSGPTLRHDLDRFIGTWVHDPETDEALSSQRRIEPGDWT